MAEDLKAPIRIYSFDVDETLEFSSGPVPWSAVRALRDSGHVVGLCGNWGHITYTLGQLWVLREVSFIGPMSMPKAEFLSQIRTYAPGFDDYVMVGNDHRIKGDSRDAEAAELAGWRFIREDDFAAGVR